MGLVYWHSHKTRHDKVIRHYGFEIFGWKITVLSKPIQTNIQDAAIRQWTRR